MSKNNKLVFITYKLTKTNILVIFTPKGGSCMDMMVGRGDIIFSGKKIQNERRKHGYSLQTLSEKTEIAFEILHSWESGREPVNLEYLLEIAEELDCSIQDFCVDGVYLKMKSNFIKKESK